MNSPHVLDLLEIFLCWFLPPTMVSVLIGYWIASLTKLTSLRNFVDRKSKNRAIIAVGLGIVASYLTYYLFVFVWLFLYFYIGNVYEPGAGEMHAGHTNALVREAFIESLIGTKHCFSNVVVCKYAPQQAIPFWKPNFIHWFSLSSFLACFAFVFGFTKSQSAEIAPVGP